MSTGHRESLIWAPFVVTGMAGDAGKRWHAAADFRRRFPLTVANAAMARPFSWALASAGLSPNMVTLLSLFASLGGLVLVAEGTLALGAIGAALVYLGLILDHADGQVARRTGRGSMFGMFLDSTLDRVIEAGMFLALVVAGVRGRAHWDDEAFWSLFRLSDVQTILLASYALFAVTMSKYVVTYSNVLFLRTHMLSGAPTPAPPPTYNIVPPKGRLAKLRRYVPGYNRDVLLAVWCLGVATGQVAPMLALLALVHTRLAVYVSRVFFKDNGQPTRHVQRVLDRDYH